MHKVETALVLVLSCIIVSYAQQIRPVVLMHGTTCDASCMRHVVDWIHEELGDDVYVKNVEIGDGYVDSIWQNMYLQCDEFCDLMASDPNLAQGFNMIGHSQGGLTTRCYIQKCNNPPVYNWISWSGPQAGEFGVPDDQKIDFIVKFWGQYVYEPWVQQNLAFSNYWKDPYALDKYMKSATYLADLNNEYPTKNQTYIDNIKSLNMMVGSTALSLIEKVLEWSSVDMVIIPRESSIFSYFAPKTNDENHVIPYNQTQSYAEDWLGIRWLEENGKLAIYETQCPHGDYPSADCKNYFDEYTLPYLKNYLPDTIN